MLNFNTIVLERIKDFSEDFETEPYEVGWAREALFFIRIHELSGEHVRLNAAVQIAADGIEWIDEGTAFAEMTRAGSYFVKVNEFGGWLRLRGRIEGENPRLRLTIYLALKS